MKTFYYKNGNKNQVCFLSAVHSWLEAHPASSWLNATVRIIKVPYKGAKRKRISIFLFTSPSYFDLEEIIRDMSIPKMIERFDQDSFRGLSLSLPKFSIAHKTDLLNTLKNMGLTILNKTVPLSGINGHGEIMLKSISHSTAITIDEEGTNMPPRKRERCHLNVSPSANVTLDRPFLFVIYDEEAKVPLFSGKVDEPISY